MKKLAITALLFYAVFLSGDVIAQNSVIAHRLDPDYQIKSTLIVEYKYPSTITCFNTEDNRTVFVLGLSNHQTIEVEISGYYVTDMDVDSVNDTVYFCGYDLNSSHHGIVGFFDVDSVFYSSGNIYLHDFFLAGDENSYVKEFKKLVYYRKSDNTPYIACIGETSNDHPCIVDIYPCLMGTYTGGYVPNKEERFTDIKYVSYSTTQYAHYFGLVTSGTESTNGTFISLRYYDRDNVISSPGDQDYRNTFCVNMYDMRKWLLNDVLVTHVKNNDNIISTVSYRRSSDSSIFQSHNNIHVAFYDLRDMVVNHSLFSMTKSVEIPGVIKRFANPKPHRYISQASTFKTVFCKRFQHPTAVTVHSAR